MNEGWDDFIREQENVRFTVRKQYKVNEERLRKIRDFSSTKRIIYPEYKEAFDYVHNLYPFVNVKQAAIYMTSKELLYDVGYTGAAGFYDTASRIVVITDYVPTYTLGENEIAGEFTPDEVLCHELIHYSAMFKSSPSTREVEEEIAYGKSINYLRNKGRSDDFIIRKNMMPYLISVVDRKTVVHRLLTRKYNVAALHTMSKEGIQELLRQEHKSLEKEMIAEAYKLGEKMIRLYGDQVDTSPLYRPRFRQLDLNDDV